MKKNRTYNESGFHLWMKTLKIKRITIFFLVFAFVQSVALSSYAQTSVNGKVSDDGGEPLPGVTVIVKGTTLGVVTNIDGDYTITDVPEGTVLQFSFVGMTTQEIEVGTKTTINITLHTDAIGLEEVVAIGYGSQKKKNLTGAISNIQNEELQKTTATSLAQKLQGKVAGLNIRQNTGEPGNYDNAINIRGFGEPLYIIDGIARGGAADFQRLSSEDIESISVLKDASAAIYGLNAANGVIIVTTKKGGEGKTKFNLNSQVGFSSPTDIVQMADAFQYYTLRNEANLNAGLAPFISEEELGKWKEGGPGYESTDWADEALKNSAFRQEHNLSIQGGSSKVSYFVNIGYTDDGGILKSNDLEYEKLNFRSNINAQLTDNFTASVNISGYTDKKTAPAAGIFSIWRGTVSSLPFRSVYANDNPDYYNRVQDGQAITPVPLSYSDLTGYSENKNTGIQTLFSLSYQVPFIEGLELKGVASYDQTFYMGKGLNKEFQMYDYDPETENYIPTPFNKPSAISNAYNNATFKTFQAHLNYKRIFKEKHNVGLTMVYEKKDQFGRHADILKYYDFYTNDQIDQAGETNASSGGNEWEARSISYLGRANYDYLGKYLIEFAARYDGSYRYHPDQRWGFFPVVSGGWRASEENFIKDNIAWLSNLKIRGSYGSIGQDAGEPFQYIPAFSTTGGGTWEFEEGKLTNGASTPAIVNKQLTWMESTIKDIGIDVGLFDQKLTFTADVYQRDREGLLAYRNVSIPNTFGGTLPQENLNSDRVRGFEFSFTHQNTVGEFMYNLSGNVNVSRTMNVYVESAPFTSSWDKYRNGASDRWSDVTWGYTLAGQFQNEEEVLNSPIQNGSLGNGRELPGDFKYEDLNGDGVIDGNDESPQFYDESPNVNFGLNFSASWKGIDVNLLFQGAANYTARYTHAYTTYFWGEGNLPAYFYDRWHMSDPYNPESSEWIPGEWPAMRPGHNLGMIYAESEAWRRPADYIRFKNIEVGYTVPQTLVQKAGLENVRLFMNINNVYTWADEYIKPFDPESISGPHAAGWIYPITRSFNFGINVNF